MFIIQNTQMKQQTKKVIRYHCTKYQTRCGDTKMNKKSPVPFYDSPLEDRILIAKWGEISLKWYV